MKPARTAGLLLGLGAAVAAGVASGLVAEHRTVRARRLRPDPLAREPFFELPSRCERTVVADDGVPLYVQEAGDPDASLTVIFLHGWVLTLDAWHFQRLDLAGDDGGEPVGRLVFYEHRGHGRSGRPRLSTCTLAQLASDLATVIDATAPTGDVVLVGHSMGGMTIMALAEQRPELFGPGGPVVGVALVSTSAGRLAQVSLGLPRLASLALQRVAPRATVGLAGLAPGLERYRRPGTDLTYSVIRRTQFGVDALPSLVSFTEAMVAANSMETLLGFVPTFLDHARADALAALRDLPAVIIVGELDQMTPADHSREIAEALPDAELVLLPGAGHMAPLERPALVSLHLRALLRRVRERAATS